MPVNPVARIAVIDDDRTTLAILTDVLHAGGFEVVSYRSGEEALAALWDAPVDLMVVDLLLPRMSGIDLVREVRARPWAQATPILAITALQWNAEQIIAIEDSMAPAQLLRKPIVGEDFLFIIQAMLAGTGRASSTAAAAGAGGHASFTPAPLPGDPPSLTVDLGTAREVLAEYGRALARGGLYVRSLQPLPEGTLVQVSLSLPFREQPVALAGQVVHAVPPESPEARVRGAGMSIALLDMPPDLQRELRAYVIGLREGAAAPPQASPRMLVLAGADDLVPREYTGFYRRSEVRVVRTPSLGAAVAIAERQRGRAALIVNGELLRGETAAAEIALLVKADVAFAAVIAGPELAARLPPELAAIDASLSPMRLLDAICQRASLAQRSSARVELQATMRGARADGPLSGRVEDISLGGLRMTTDAPCAVGERLEVEFELPDGAGRVKGSASAVRVARLRPDALEVSVGAAFERLDDDSVDVLRRFLEARVGAEAYRRYMGIASVSTQAG